MPTITVLLGAGEVGKTGTRRLKFYPRQPFTSGSAIIPVDRVGPKVFTRDVAGTVSLATGPWMVLGLDGAKPIYFDVGTDDADLKDLISLTISGTIPTTATLTEIVNAWMAEHGGISKAEADANYAPAAENSGTTGQVLTKTATGAQWSPAPSGGGVVATDNGDGTFSLSSSTGALVDHGDGTWTLTT